ncbi:hypothetical protein [Methylocaldum marinum]|nr:hypothetical protein [Methylocaldum marinum]
MNPRIDPLACLVLMLGADADLNGSAGVLELVDDRRGRAAS